MQRYRSTRLFLASLALVVPAALSAQAFGLNEIGTCAVSRGFATTASPCRDASTIFWNPAAATWLTGWNATVGVAAVTVNGDFDQDTTFRRFDADVPTSWVPHVFVNYHNAKSKFAYGLGVYVPYGLTTQWHDDFPGRFSVLKATLSTVYVQPNIAWTAELEVVDRRRPDRRPLECRAHTGRRSVRPADLGGRSDVRHARHRPRHRVRAREAQGAAARPTAHRSGSGADRPRNGASVSARCPQLQFRYNDADATFSQVNTNLIVGGTIPGTPFQAGTKIDTLLAPQFIDWRSARLAVGVDAHRTSGAGPGRSRLHRLQELAPRGGLLLGRLEELQGPAD